MLNRSLLLLILIITYTSTAFSQRYVDINSLHSDYVKKNSRENFIIELQQKTNHTFSGRLGSQTEKSWKSLFREIELANYRSEKVFKAAEISVNYATRSNVSFQRAVIEFIYTLYPDDFYDEIYNIVLSTQNSQVFSTACIYLLNHNKTLVDKETLRNKLESKFPEFATDPLLKFLHLDLSLHSFRTFSDSLFVNLLSHPFQSGKTIIYSIHRKNRQFPGITIIKKSDGKFVRDNDSTIFYVPQLAHSTSGLPGYISQGDTPQGVFSVVGFYISPTESIGPTPNVLTRIPFEVPTKIFYHNEVESNRWHYENYKNLLPAGWQDHPWIYESYFAGKSGRRLIVMHGSTDDISFFNDEEYYPLTPSKGCLTTIEIWSEETGLCVESDQVKLMNAFFSTGQLYGFLVVVNLDDSKHPVTIEELKPFIEAAESHISQEKN